MSEEGKKIEKFSKEGLFDINIDNLKKEEVDELLKNFGKSEIYDENIRQMFNNRKNVEYLELCIYQYIPYLSENSIKNLFSILIRNNVEPVFTNENLVKLLENVEYNNKFSTIIKLLNSREINEIVRNLKTKNGFSNLLLCINKDRLSEISLNKIDISIIIESLEDEEFFEKLKLMYSNPNNVKCCFLLRQLNNEKVNEFLSKLNLDEKIEKISYKDFKINEISDFIEKTKNIDFAKKCFMEIDDKEISWYRFSESSIDILAELIKTLDENDPVFKKIILINYYNYGDKEYFAELLDKIDKENVIKLLNNVSFDTCFIGADIIEKKLLDIVGDKKIIKKRMLKEKIFAILETGKPALILENNYDILEETLKELKDEEITKINLSYICSNKNGELGKFIKRIIDEYPSNRIPQFNIDAISEFDLFEAIKKGKIKNTNIQKPSNKNIKKSKNKNTSNHRLLFLTDTEGFNIAQKIIIEDNFFVKNPKTEEIEYNKEFLKDLYNKLNDKEIFLFFEFYYENSGKKEYFKREELEEKLKKGLRDITITLEVNLFNNIKKGVKNIDIPKRLQPKLLFLNDGKKFNIIQKIIAEDNFFVKNPETKIIEYNKEVLSKLYSELNIKEMLLFFEFYYDNSEKIKQLSEGEELKERLKEELKEELKDIYKGIEATDMLCNDFFNSNSKLKTEGHPDGYIKNRQRNKNFLIDILLEKNQRRIERIERLKEIENREKIFKMNYNSKNINKLANEKEELEYIIRKYHYETLRRAIVDYSRRIEPFVKKHFDSKNTEEITRNIEDALGILFHPDSSNAFKLEAQKNLRNNIDKIGGEYKKFMREKKEIDITGSHLMFSSICNAKDINELQEALYSHIRMKMVNDYVTKHSFGTDGNKDKKTLLKTDSDKIYRAYDNLNEEELKEALYNFTCSPLAQTGREQYKTFDMITKEENEKNGNSVNIKCGNENNIRDSLAGSYTSFSNKSWNIKNYATSILSVYTPTENSKKSLFTDVANRKLSEVAGFDILPEDIIMNIVPEKDRLKVVFNTNMDFVTFKLRKEIEVNGKSYEAGKYISQDDLENIIANKYKKMTDITEFLDNNLFIEKSFSKNQILGEEKEIKEEDEEEKSKKTFKTEKRIIDIKKRTEAKIHPFYEKDITPIEKNDDDIHTYIIPDVHGALDEFIEDLEGIGLITIEENEFVWYRIDDSGFEVPIHEKPKDYEINKNNYIQIPRFTINKNFNGRVIQLGDLVDSHEGSTKSKECLAISILLSKQLREKYTTLVGNHEIAKLCGNKYKMDESNVTYEVPAIREAIKNGTIKLFHHTPGSNIINSHVPLFKDNILTPISLFIPTSSLFLADRPIYY